MRYVYFDRFVGHFCWHFDGAQILWVGEFWHSYCCIFCKLSSTISVDMFGDFTEFPVQSFIFLAHFLDETWILLVSKLDSLNFWTAGEHKRLIIVSF